MSLDLPPLRPFDAYDPGSMVIIVGPRDNFGKRAVTARCRGRSHVDRFDTDDHLRRSKFRAEVMNIFRIEDEGFHEWAETEILEQARAIDSSKSTELFRPALTMLNTVTATKVEWLWRNRIAIAKNNLVAGSPGLGKSLATLDIAARVSSGAGFPDSHLEEREPAGVLILTQEDDEDDTIVPRLTSAGADLNYIGILHGRADTSGDCKEIQAIDLLHDIEMVTESIGRIPNCKLVIYDTISDYLPAKIDSHKNSEVRFSILNPLKRLAREHRVANLIISHLRKGEGAAVNSVLGSIAFVGQCRTAWAVTRCPSNPKRRLMTAIKSNLSDDNSGLAFQIESSSYDSEVPILAWEAEPVRMSADQAMAQSHQPRGRKPEQREDAADWLARQLADGPKPAADILTAGEAAGHKSWTVRRAFKQLDGKPSKRGFGGSWVWSLPQDDIEDYSSAQGTEFSNQCHLRENPEENIPKRVLNRTVSPLMTNSERQVELEAFNAELANCNGRHDVPF